MLNVLKWSLDFLKKYYNCSSFCLVPLFRGVPMVLRQCFVAIPGCSVVPPLSLGVPLFRERSVFFCSLVFRCSASVPCSVVPCSGVPDFIVCPSRGGIRKRCSENIQQIYRRTAMPKCDFNKVALQGGASWTLDFFETTLNHHIKYWKYRREETIFLLFKRISWDNWPGMTLDNPLRHWFGFIIIF